MTYVKHSEYLQTDYWQWIKDKMYAKYRCCQLCGKAWDLQVHHLCYDHFYAEIPGRSIVLTCDNCHHACHWSMGIYKVPLTEKALRKRFETLRFRRTKSWRNLRSSHIIGWIGDFTVFLAKAVHKAYSVN